MTTSSKTRALGIRDSYLYYKEQVGDNAISLNTYTKVVGMYLNYLSDLLVDGEIIGLPERLGIMFFLGRKQKPRIDTETGLVKGVAPDWASTKKLWNEHPEAREKKDMVFLFNENTNGYRYRLTWSKKKVFLHNKDFYSFRLTRDNKHKFNCALKEGKEYLTM